MKILAVVLIGYAVSAGDDCAAEARKPEQCYHCSTYSNEKYCADPFNKTHPDVKTIKCDASCAKWVRKPKTGPNHYIRTCSSNLNLQMPVSLVCMKESRPGDGHLCFCNKENCNGANGARGWGVMPLLIITLLCMIISGNMQFIELSSLLSHGKVIFPSCDKSNESGVTYRSKYKLRRKRWNSHVDHVTRSASHCSETQRHDHHHPNDSHVYTDM